MSSRRKNMFKRSYLKKELVAFQDLRGQRVRNRVSEWENVRRDRQRPGFVHAFCAMFRV